MNVIEQYLPVVLFILLYNLGGSTFQSVDEIIIVTIQMNAIEQYFAVLLLVMYVVKGGSNF